MTYLINRYDAGFSLAELMIVVAIVGILAIVGYPTYQKFTKETRRSDAHIALTKLATDMEKFYAECGQYASSLGGTRKCADANPGLQYTADGGLFLSPEKFYSLSVALTASANGYTLTATPRLGQAKDTGCATLTLDSKGIKNATGSDSARCLRR